MQDDGPIPKTLEDALAALDALLTEESKAAFRAQEGKGQHFQLGLYMRNNWLNQEGSPLRQFFEWTHLGHTDSISSALLTAYYRHLTEPTFDPASFFKKLREPWDKKPTPAQIAAEMERRSGEPIGFAGAAEGDRVECGLQKLGELWHEESGWRAELHWREAWVAFDHPPRDNAREEYFDAALWDALARLGSRGVLKGNLPPYKQLGTREGWWKRFWRLF
jgi:hypothetical protein